MILMVECKSLSGCIFFNDKMPNMPTTANLFKQEYCKTNFKACARFIVSKTLGKLSLPNDLFPNQEEKAKILISKT